MTTPSSAGRAVRLTVDKNSVVVEVLDGDKTLDRDRLNPDMKAKRKAAAKMLGVEDGQLLEWIDRTREAATKGDARPQTFVMPRQDDTGGTIIVRDMDGTDDSGDRHDLVVPGVLKTLIPDVPNDKLIKWANDSLLCCVDVDYHESGRPAPHDSWLRARVAADLAPRPYAWHFSKGGGLHLFYIKSDPFTAKELAAVAALCWRRIDPSATVELKTGVRGPAAGGKQTETKTVHYAPGEVQDSTSLLAGWIERTPADETARDEWLAAEGMELGKRYDHTKCPIFPTPGYKSTGDPVVVLDSGIYCHRCDGEGRSLGCKRSGFAPFNVVIGGESAGDLGEMIRNQCHWGHAKFVLTEKYGVPEALAEFAYRAALKAYWHGKQKSALLPLVFARSTADLTRTGDLWYNFDSSSEWKDDGIRPVLSKLPYVCDVGDDNTPKCDDAMVSVLCQAHDLGKHGLPLVETIFGYRMKRPHLADPSDPATVERFPSHLKKGGGRFLPRYVPASRRDSEKAWAHLDSLFPDIDRKLVSLIMCAIGSAQEVQMGQHPKLFISGASGAAKSTTAMIAAAILGSVSAEFLHRGDESRWGQQMWRAMKNGGLVLCNELVKDAERAAGCTNKFQVRQAFDPFLTLTRDAAPNILYLGPRKYGRLQAIVMTEPSLPLSLRDEIQVSRRIWYWRVNGAKTWHKNSAFSRGLTEVPLLRCFSTETADACNAIMSEVIDTYFYKPISWDDMATAHGCEKISESSEFEDLTPWLREFYRLVCLAPKIENARVAARYPNGYKRITRDGEVTKEQKKNDAFIGDDPLTTTYTMFTDGRGSDWLSARRLTEKDWSGILQSNDPVTLDLTNDGVHVYARFRVGRVDRPTKVNEQIIDPTNWEAKT